MGQFFLMDLVSMIPLLNIVLLLVWSFADNTNPNRRNLARARLIWVAIGIVCSILLLLIAIWAMKQHLLVPAVLSAAPSRADS